MLLNSDFGFNRDQADYQCVTDIGEGVDMGEKVVVPDWRGRSYAVLHDLIPLLIERGWQLAVAESCTGGLVSKICTDTSGSSAWFCGGVVVYSCRLKTRMLGVDAKGLEEHGAVSRWCVERMVEGLCKSMPWAEVFLSISGVAGPLGGTPANPVGSVWMARHSRGDTLSQHWNFKGWREDIREQSAWRALEMLIELKG